MKVGLLFLVITYSSLILFPRCTTAIPVESKKEDIRNDTARYDSPTQDFNRVFIGTLSPQTL